MSLIETLGINVVLLSFLMYIDFNYFNFNFNFKSRFNFIFKEPDAYIAAGRDIGYINPRRILFQTSIL